MMEEADEHPEVLHAEDPTIARQLQEAAQTNVIAGNGSSPASPKVPSLIQAPAPLPQFATLSSPSATIPTTVTVAASPTSKNPGLPSPLKGSQLTTPTVPSVTPSPVMPPVITSPATTTSSQVTAPAQLESPREASSSVPVTTTADDVAPQSPQGGGILGWGRGVVNKIAEKTKSSVETVITTLDPGMKELILSGGDIDVVVTSAKENKVSPVRDAFQEVFGKATITGQESSANTAAQPVGFTAGLKGAEERIQNLRHSGAIHEKQPVLSVEGFVAELLPDRWYELSCLVLQDPGNNIELQTFSQATLVPAAIIQRMQDGTAPDYPMRWSGMAVTVGQAVEEAFPHISRTNWQEALTSVKRKQTLYLAVKSLAEMYRQRLPSSS